MKKLFSLLFVALATLTLKAQDTATVKAKYEYAFVYVNFSADSLKIYFSNGKTVNLSATSNKNFMKAPLTDYSSIVRGFDFYVDAFNYLEAQGYEFMGTGSYMYDHNSASYYIYRRKKRN